ncbi:unnamed protein product, partial [Symbiodinium necroappetens]
AECQVDNFGRLDMKLYNAWNGLLAAPKPSLADLDTWPMDDVLIYNHPQYHLYVGSLVCPFRFDELRMYPDVVIAMNRDDPPRSCEPSDWYKHLEACGPFGTAHLRYGGWDQTHANDFDAEQRTHEFKKSWHRLVSDFRQLLTCWHRDDDSRGRQSADVQSDIKKGKGFNKGKSTKKKKKGSSAPGPCSPYGPSWSSHGKAIGKAYIPGYDPNGPAASSQGKAVNKGYLKNANPTVSAPARLGKATSKGHVKCSNGKGGFDARQSAAAARQSALASGLQMDEESFPGELAQALEVLEKKKAGPDVWNSCCQRRRPLRVLVHCYGGVNRSGGRQPVSPVQTLLVIIIGAVLSFRLVIPNDAKGDGTVLGKFISDRLANQSRLYNEKETMQLVFKAFKFILQVQMHHLEQEGAFLADLHENNITVMSDGNGGPLDVQFAFVDASGLLTVKGPKR